MPGQSVKPVSRWPETVRRKTGRPAGKRALPPEMNESVDAGSTCAMSSRQASSAASASRAFWETASELYSPSSETPTEPVLKPSAWAPTTFRSIPP